VNHTLFYPDPTQTQQQHQPFIKHLGFGFFKALDHSLSTISPYLMKTNPWLLVLILIEFETAPAKQKAMQSRASLIAGYDHTSTSFLHKSKSKKTNQN